jgi:tRNA nucleotidyltransferase (CCA-adding enzyme)
VTTILTFLKNIFTPFQQKLVFLVGGSVRDSLLGKESHDIDLVAALSPEELIALGFHLVEATSGSSIYFKHFSEIGKIEISRIDKITELNDELLRRDFTINAIAMDLSGSYIDPLNGKEDIKSGKLKACTDHTFTDDPLRLFRAFRFEADGWRMTRDTETLIRAKDWSVGLSAMPVERFTLEMLKALAQKTPERFFQKMIEFNVGTDILPELFRMPEIPAGPLQHHPEGDLFSHSIQVLQRVAAITNDPLSRFCALFHDIGKLATEPQLYPKHHGHDQAGFSLAVEFCNRLSLSTAYRKSLAWTSSLHGKANLWDTLRDSTKLAMAEQAIRADVDEILPIVAAADKAGGLPMIGWADALRVAGMSTRELEIDQEKLTAMPVNKRSALILQKRVQAFKESRTRFLACNCNERPTSITG